MLRIFTPVKIEQLRPGLNKQTWVPEASMLTTRPPKPSRDPCTRENIEYEEASQCTYNVTLRHVRATIVAVEKK